MLFQIPLLMPAALAAETKKFGTRYMVHLLSLVIYPCLIPLDINKGNRRAPTDHAPENAHLLQEG